MKTHLSVLLLFCAAVFSFGQTQTPTSPMVMCSSTEMATADAGKCTGSRYCTACSNCKYCKHCNSGGTCGVCTPGAYKRRSTPAPAPRTYGNSGTSSAGKRTNPNPGTSTPSPGRSQWYTVTAATSFRMQATHESGVLLRFAPGNEVLLLEKTSQYWWKVRFDGKVGWIKAALLLKL